MAKQLNNIDIVSLAESIASGELDIRSLPTFRFQKKLRNELVLLGMEPVVANRLIGLAEISISNYQEGDELFDSFISQLSSMLYKGYVAYVEEFGEESYVLSCRHLKFVS